MPRNAKFNITPENGWRFTALSILPRFEGQSYEAPFKSETVYLGSRTLEAGVKQAAASEANTFVEVVPFPSETVRGTHKEILWRTKQLIYEQVLKTQEDNRGLILGFSAWGEQQSLDVMDLLAFTRKISGDRVVCVVGGPELSVYSPRTAADFIAAGADIVNFGGGKELAEWLGRLRKSDVFKRDTRGYLKAPIPPKAPFFSALSKSFGLKSGGELPAPVDYDPSSKTIYVYLPDSGCSNDCDFCSVGKSLVGPHSPRNDDELAKQVNAILADIKSAKAREEKQAHAVIRHAKATIKRIKAKRNKLMPEDILSLDIANPNPAQGHGLDRFENFLSKIDMTVPLRVVHFFDALSFRTEKGMQRQLAYIEKQLTQHKNLRLHIDVAIDALQAVNDGDFIGRRIGKRPVTQDEYDAILKNHRVFMKEISGKEWSNRLSMGLNQIIHPAMTAEVYLKKFDLMGEKGEGFIFQPKEFILLPHNGTRLAEKYKGNFAPMDFMEKDWELGTLFPSNILSCWGNRFKNGDFLDCIALSLMAHQSTDNMYYLAVLDALTSGWDDDKAKFGILKNAINPKIANKILEDAQKILDSKPRVIGLMKRYMELLDAVEAKGDKMDTLGFACGINASVNWILRRERYLSWNNPAYANDPNCRKLIQEAKEIRKRLLSKPYADKYNVCPPRHYPLKTEGTVRAISRRAGTGNAKYLSVRRPQRHLARNGYFNRFAVS